MDFGDLPSGVAVADIMATWHTHPETTGNLSVEDYALFTRHAGMHHCIIDKQSLWIYKVEGNTVFLYDEENDSF